MHICQCGVRSDEQYSLTYGGTSCHFDNLAVLPFALTLLFLHGTTSLFLDHPFDVLIVRLQFGTAEVRVYPLLVIRREFGYHIYLGFSDVAHILGSSPVMSLA